jgi:hypothetical protein
MSSIRRVGKDYKVLVSFTGKVTKSNGLSAVIEKVAKDKVTLFSETLKENAPKTEGMIHVPMDQVLTRMMSLDLQPVKVIVPEKKRQYRTNNRLMNKIRIVTQRKLDDQKARKRTLAAARKDEERRLALKAAEERDQAVNGIKVELKTKEEGGEING